MTITIRDARVEDAAAITAVNLASWEAAYRPVAGAFLDGVNRAERETQWREVLTAGDSTVLVAESGAELVAYCRMELPSREEDAAAHTAQIRALYVRPASFRTGVGSTLMRAALSLLAQHGFVEVTLWVVSENHRARAFYAHHGFTADGSVSFWLDHIEQLRLRRPL